MSQTTKAIAEQPPAIDKKTEQLKAVLSEAIFLDEELDQPPPVITIQNKTILTSGNFAVLCGLPKSRKTTFAFFMLASALTGKTFFDISVNLQPDDKCLLIDTEQSVFDFSKQVKTLKYLIKQKKLPENFSAYLFRKYEPDVILNSVYLLIKEQRPKLIILDNLTELVINPNDMLESKTVIQFLKRITAEFNCSVICLLHLAKSNLMSLGNLGSYADRGAQSVLRVTLDKETQTSTLEASLMRSDLFFNPIAVSFDSEQKCFVQTEAVSEKPKSKKLVLADLTAGDHWNRIGVIFNSEPELTYSELIEELKKLYGVGTNISKQQVLPYLLGNNFLQRENGIYKPNYSKTKKQK